MRASFCRLGSCKRHNTGQGRTSIKRSVAMLGNAMPCQKCAELIQCVSTSVKSQRAEKGRHDARDVTTPMKAITTTNPAVM